MRHGRFFVIEAAGLAALTLALMLGTWAAAAGAGISSALVRLHVVAVSDSEAEQAVKLEVRDAVLGYLTPVLADADSPAEARELIAGHLEGVADAALTAAGGRAVHVELGGEYYPTRDYGSFSLPAGRYMSLRVTLGEGRGHNWWCVVFPPLCLTAAEGAEAASAIGALGGIIAEDGAGTVFRFRLVELWGELRAWLGL